MKRGAFFKVIFIIRGYNACDEVRKYERNFSNDIEKKVLII